MSSSLSYLLPLIFLLFTSLPSPSSALTPAQPLPESLADLKEAIVKGLGFQADDMEVTGFDPRDALVGHSVAYEFDVEVDDRVLPVKLLEDVAAWDYVDLPLFHPAGGAALVDATKVDDQLPVLAPFQLAGPMEIWIQDAKDMRISLPAFARIENHYFVNKGFFTSDSFLLENVDKIRHINTTIVQGRYDVCCPMMSAWDLHKAWPEADLKVVADAGHSANEPGITAELVAANEKLKDIIKNKC